MPCALLELYIRLVKSDLGQPINFFESLYVECRSVIDIQSVDCLQYMRKEVKWV